VSLSLVREYNPTRIHVLTPEQIAQELSTLAGWEAKDDMISA